MNETQPDILLFGLIATFTPIPEGIVIFLQISQRWLVVLVHVDSAMLMTQYICEGMEGHQGRPGHLGCGCKDRV